MSSDSSDTLITRESRAEEEVFLVLVLFTESSLTDHQSLSIKVKIIADLVNHSAELITGNAGNTGNLNLNRFQFFPGE